VEAVPLVVNLRGAVGCVGDDQTFEEAAGDGPHGSEHAARSRIPGTKKIRSYKERAVKRREPRAIWEVRARLESETIIRSDAVASLGALPICRFCNGFAAKQADAGTRTPDHHYEVFSASSPGRMVKPNRLSGSPACATRVPICAAPALGGGAQRHSAESSSLAKGNRLGRTRAAARSTHAPAPQGRRRFDHRQPSPEPATPQALGRSRLAHVLRIVRRGLRQRAR
jgi:hypothetical protein